MAGYAFVVDHQWTLRLAWKTLNERIPFSFFFFLTRSRSENGLPVIQHFVNYRACTGAVQNRWLYSSVLDLTFTLMARNKSPSWVTFSSLRVRRCNGFLYFSRKNFRPAKIFQVYFNSTKVELETGARFFTVTCIYSFIFLFYSAD